jgi:ribosome-binding factor A
MGDPKHTLRRIREEIKRHLGEILQFEARDPRLEWVTVMDVTLSRDLRRATVYVSTLDDASAEETLAVLREHRGFLRSELAKRMRLRRVPELRFEPDLAAARAQRIEQLLAEEARPSESEG